MLGTAAFAQSLSKQPKTNRDLSIVEEFEYRKKEGGPWGPSRSAGILIRPDYPLSYHRSGTGHHLSPIPKLSGLAAVPDRRKGKRATTQRKSRTIGSALPIR